MRKTALLAVIVAILAGGTATAASRWVITSTHQIKPSVLNQLRSTLHTQTVKGPIQTMFSVVVGQPAIATATCPAGTFVVGGGWDQGPVPATSENISDSEASGNGWEVIAENEGDQTATIIAAATCASLK